MGLAVEMNDRCSSPQRALHNNRAIAPRRGRVVEMNELLSGSDEIAVELQFLKKAVSGVSVHIPESHGKRHAPTQRQ